MSRFWSAVVRHLSPYVPGELAGLRVGFAIGQRALIEALERVKDSFVFARHPDHGGAALASRLREHGVLVRHFRKKRIEDYLRISVGTEDHCSRLIGLLSDLT